MLIPDEQKTYFLARHEALMKDDAADPEEVRIVEAAIAIMGMEEAVALKEDDYNDLDALGHAIEGLLKIVFGNDVDITNISDRFTKLADQIDNDLQLAEIEEAATPTNKKFMAELHLKLAQKSC